MRHREYARLGVILGGLSLLFSATSPAGAEPPAGQVELRSEQASRGLSLRLEQRQVRLPDDAAGRQRAEQDLQRERFRQDQLHQRQLGDRAMLRQQERVEQLPKPKAGFAQRSQRRLHQQQEVGQRLQFRLERRY